MKHLFVSYELALKLKEKGFDEPCFAHYQNSKGFIPQRAILASSSMLYYQQENINPSNQYGDQFCTAPLYQQVVDWFREKHDIVVQIDLFDYGSLGSELPCFQWRIFNKSDSPETTLISNSESLTIYDMYSEAIEEALKLI